jgi:hypothetical protein
MNRFPDTSCDSNRLDPREACDLPLRSVPWLEDDSSRSAATPTQSGSRPGTRGPVKKSIKNEPADAPWIPFSCACLPVAHSLSDEDSGSSESDSDSDSDSDSGTDDEELTSYSDSSWERLNPASNHEYQYLRPSLLQRVYDQFCDWRTSIRYAIPPGHRQPSRKRGRGAVQTPRVAYLHDEDPADPEVVVVHRIDGYYHLACPFYRQDPVCHHRCAHTHDLQTISDVIMHLQRHHRMPAHCPICRTIFADPRTRDAHVRGRTCTSQPEIQMDGVDSQTMSRIIRRDDPYVREDVRWLRISHCIFGSSPPNRAPYLTDGIGLEVSLLRDYLSGDGRNCVLEHIRHSGLLNGRRDEKTISVLCFLTLQDLVGKIVLDNGGWPRRQEDMGGIGIVG